MSLKDLVFGRLRIVMQNVILLAAANVGVYGQAILLVILGIS